MTCAKRLADLGIRRASEDDLIRWALTLPIDAEFRLNGKWPCYWHIYDRVNRVKKLLTSLTPHTGPFMDKYPEPPSSLPHDMYKIAYTDSGPPIHRHIARYEALSQHIPLRKP